MQTTTFCFRCHGKFNVITFFFFFFAFKFEFLMRFQLITWFLPSMCMNIEWQSVAMLRSRSCCVWSCRVSRTGCRSCPPVELWLLREPGKPESGLHQCHQCLRWAAHQVAIPQTAQPVVHSGNPGEPCVQINHPKPCLSLHIMNINQSKAFTCTTQRSYLTFLFFCFHSWEYIRRKHLNVSTIFDY